MHSPNKLPYGKPLFFEGEYKYDKIYPLYIQRMKCQFELLEGGIPCIQLKNSRGFVPTEYLSSSNGEQIVLTLTNIDLELIRDNYKLKDIEYVCGWKFRAVTGIFDSYIDYWTDIKIQATKDGNPGLRSIAKLMLNALYGKFATSPYVRSAIPYQTENGVKFRKTEKVEREKNQRVYLPVGEYITSIARNKTIRSCKACIDRIIYSDTDSMHLLGNSIPEGIEVDSVKLGAWKIEETWIKGKFLRAKTYIEELIISDKEYEKLIEEKTPNVYEKDGIKHRLKVTVAGLPKTAHGNVTFENFTEGAVFGGKLMPKTVKGGVVLVDTTFKIKE